MVPANLPKPNALDMSALHGKCWLSNRIFATKTSHSNECKRRKVKCDGEEPCQRCVYGMISCSYCRGSRSEPLMALNENMLDATARPTAATENSIVQMATNLQTLMDQVKSLQDKIEATSPQGHSAEDTRPMQQTTFMERTIATSSEPLQTEGPPGQANQDENAQTTFPQYYGPTSSEFSFNVANKILGAGYSVEGDAQVDSSALLQPGKTSQANGLILRRTVRQDPLWTVVQSDVPRYIDGYRDSLGVLYPILDCERLKSKADILFQAMIGPYGQKKEIELGSVVDLLFNHDTQLLKVILAIGILNDMSVADSSTALSLVQSVLDSSETSLLHIQGLDGVHILVLCVCLGI